MPVRMRIEYVSPERSGHYVFARRLEEKDFHLSPASRLGGIAIQPVVSQPRKLKDDGSVDLEVSAFVLVSAADLPRFAVGSEVLLEEAPNQSSQPTSLTRRG